MTDAPLIGNEMIFASAGSGKTYALTNRYIRLMALGVPPERIIALTFTRKAAGEFFDAILEKLAEAATTPEQATRLAADIEIPNLRAADFLGHLRTLVSDMHRLSLGTLDSFFSSILRNFPFEFGLSGGFEILDGHAADRARAAVYERVFRRDPRRRQEQDDFLESFRLATFGSEESSLMRELQTFVDDFHRHFLEAPHAGQWGNPAAIWPQGSLWVPPPGESTDALLASLFTRFERAPLKEKQWTRWREFREALATHGPGLPMENPLKYLLEKLLNHLPEIIGGSAELAYDRGKQTLDAEECDLVLKVIAQIIGDDLSIRLRRTRGIWSVLDRYESAYRELIRRRGRLTFSDILVVLAGGEEATRAGLVLTQGDAEDRRANRLHIDYRLDARYDHWLLDEFQDTSRPQWRVIANLIDEAVQDISGTRSLFQVGDLKQAIYAWRGGDVRLFEEIRETYRDRVTERPLNDSWRSAPPIIEMVNTVFGSVRTMNGFFPEEVRQRWEWGEHVSKHPEWTGHACLLRPSEGGPGEESKDERRFAIVAQILRELRPAERGLSCAILVQAKKAGEAVVDYLRANLSEVPVQSEADAAVASDNPLAAAILALFQFTAHPGDTYAREHLRMTPLGVMPDGMDTSRVRADIHHHGFELPKAVLCSTPSPPPAPNPSARPPRPSISEPTKASTPSSPPRSLTRPPNRSRAVWCRS
jgi:ATP-dependent helicase/nuclease subunit A